jgi:hypothetical protein
MVITKIAVNTGSMHFSTLEELSAFASRFSLIQNIRAAVAQRKAAGSIVKSQTLLTSSNTWEETITSPVEMSLGFDTEFAALMASLGWTFEKTVSHTYD